MQLVGSFCTPRPRIVGAEFRFLLWLALASQGHFAYSKAMSREAETALRHLDEQCIRKSQTGEEETNMASENRPFYIKRELLSQVVSSPSKDHKSGWRAQHYQQTIQERQPEYREEVGSGRVTASQPSLRPRSAPSARGWEASSEIQTAGGATQQKPPSEARRLISPSLNTHHQCAQRRRVPRRS